MLILYRIITWIVLPIALLRLLLRSYREPGYRYHLSERIGLTQHKTTRPMIWLHAVSVGEINAAADIAYEIDAKFEQHDLLVTCSTPSGRKFGESILPIGTKVAYLPIDTAFFVNRFLTRIRPVCLLVMETEIWPNLFIQCSKASIPIYLLNARLSERSMRKYLRFKNLTKLVTATVKTTVAQSENDASRLSRIGIKNPQVFGNLKFDKALNETKNNNLQKIDQLIDIQKTVIVASSTRENEEILIVDEFLKQCGPETLLVIVPRHARRFDEVAKILKQRKVLFSRRSNAGTFSETCRVFLGDSMGEMYSYYSSADIVLMGGSFLPNGGQNPIEPLAMGKCVVAGPHTFNFDEVVSKGEEAGVIYQSEDITDAVTRIVQLTNDPALLTQKSTLARQFVKAHAGALQKTLEYLHSERPGWR